MTIHLSDMRVAPAGRYHAPRPAPLWEIDYATDPTTWGTRFLDPAIEAVGPHCGAPLLNVTGAPGVSVVLDAAVTDDGFSSGPLVCLMPALHYRGRNLLRQALEPLGFADLYPDHLTEDGDVIASPDSTHGSHAEFLEYLAPRVCRLINEHLDDLAGVSVDMPDVPDWQRHETIGTVTVKPRWDARGRPSTAQTATSVAAEFGLRILAAASTVHHQAIAFGAGLAELAPEIDATETFADGGGCSVEISGPTTALPPVARRYLVRLDADPDIDVDITIDGAAILHP